MPPLQIKNMEELKELMNSLISPIVKEEMKLLNIGKTDRRFPLYPTEDAMMGRERLTPEAADKITRFFRGLMHPDARYQEIPVHGGSTVGPLWRDLSIGSAVGGGYLVPTEFHAEVILYLLKKPVMRNICKVIPIPGKMEVPKVTTRPGMSWPGENAVATGTQPVFGTLTLSSKLGLAMVPMSRQLFEHAGVDVIGLLTQLFGDAFGAGEDTVIVNGTGSGQPTGFRVHSPAPTTVAQAGASLTGDDIISLYFALPSQYRGNATWIIHNSRIQTLRTLKDSYGRYLWADGGGFASAPATILGRPVLEQNDIPTNLGSDSPADESEIWFGDFQFYYLGDAETMGVEVTTEGAGTFEKHQVAIKGFEEIDGDLAVEDAFRTMTGVE